MLRVDLEEAANLLQIQAELRLAASAASAANFLRALLPAPNLERKMVNELQMKPLAPISKGIERSVGQKRALIRKKCEFWDALL